MSKVKLKRRRHIDLVMLFFEEISSVVDGEFSFQEMMQASDSLIKIMKDEVVINYREYGVSSNYFSMDLCRAMGSMSYKILYVESELQRDWHGLSPDSEDELFVVNNDAWGFGIVH